jgi:hypothetical protein
MHNFVLVLWLYGSNFAPTVTDLTYTSLADCEQAGAIWDKSQATSMGNFQHHACLPTSNR